MNQVQTIQKIIKNVVIAMAGLLMLSNSVMANELLYPLPEISGQIRSAGWLDDSYFEHSGPEFAVEIGDKALDHESIVKFQAEPVKAGNWLSSLTKLAGFDNKLGVQFGLIDNNNTDLTASVTALEPSWWGRAISKFNQSNNSTVDGQILSIDDRANNIIVKYSPLANGLKEELVINGDKDVSSVYRYQLKTDNNVLINKAVSGNSWNLPVDTIYFTDRDGNYFAHFLPMTAYDSIGAMTSNINAKYELLNNNIYLLTVTVDQEWLFSTDRQYPVIIDPTIVHDTQGEFNNGTALNRVEVTSDPKVQLTYTANGSDMQTAGLWHMEETGSSIVDSSGNGNTGTATNTTNETGKIGNARGYADNNDYITVADHASLKPSQQISVEAWVNPTSIDSYDVILMKSSWTWTNGYGLYSLSGGNDIHFYINNYSSYKASGTLELNKWSHIVGTYDGNVIKLFINGKLVSSVDYISSTINHVSDPLYIGMGAGGGGSSYIWNGKLDEVAIYQKALTEEEIIAHAQLKPYGVYTSEVIDTGTTSPILNSLSWTEHGVATGDGETDLTTNGLVASWNLNETSGTTASNFAGSCGSQCNATLTGFANTSGQDVDPGEGWTAANKKWGAGAVMLPGDTATYINNSSSTYSFTGNLTVATWFKADSCGNTSWPHIFQYYSPNYFNMNLDCNQNQYEIAIGTPSGNYTNEYNYNPRQDFGQWQFLVGVFDDTNDQVHLYKNGKLLQTVSSVAGTPTWQYFNIGFQQTLSRYFDGTIDSTKVYNRVLDINEINSLYQIGNVQLQTRTGADSSPDDGSWEAWKPSGGGVETQIDNFDNNEANLHVFENAWSNANTNQNWVKKNNATASTTCDSGSSCSYTDGRMGLGSTGRGDDANIYSGNVFKDGSTYKMYYYGYDGAVGRIYYAYSSDGLTWTKNDNNIESPSDTTGTNGRLPISATAGTGDDASIAYSTVIKDGSTYKMWYGGSDGSKYRIYYATSSDGLTWTKANITIPTTCDSGSACPYGDGRLGLGTSGTGDDNNIYAPYVFKDGSTYKMYYTGDDGADRHIFLATSSDGLTWTKYNNALPADSDSISTDGRIPTGTSGTGDDAYLYMGTVIKEGGYYRAWYSGQDGTYWRSYYAVSPDGLTWKKINNTIPADSSTIAYNGQIPQGLAGSGDDDHALLPRVIYENGIYKMWYAGEDGAAFRIYHASMAPLPCKNETVTNIKLEGTGSEKFTTGYQMSDSVTVGLWHLDETGGSGAYLKDSSGNGNHGTPTGTTVTNGLSQKARNFNGSSDYISAADSSTLDMTSSPITVEIWFKRDVVGAISGLISKGGNGEYSPYTLVIDSANTIYFLESSDGSSWATMINSTATIIDNNWHYLVATNNLTTAYLYLDGVQIGSDTSPATSRWNNSSVLTIGAENKPSDNTKGRFHDGLIDEVKIDNVARTSDEIAEAYRLGRDHRFHNSLTSAIDLSDKSLVPVSIASDQPGTHLEVTFGESEFANNVPDANTLGLWHLEEQTGSGAYIKDSSSYAQHGTPTGTTFIQGKIGQGRSFNGSSDYVNIPDDANNSFGNGTTDTAFSVSAWIYRNGNNNDPIISKDTGASVREWQLVPWSDNYLYWSMYDNDGANRISKRVPNANVLLSSGSWHYVVANYDGSGSSNGLSVYIDGQRVDSSTDVDNAGTYVAMHDTTSPLRIGNGNTGTYYFNGRLDEVRLDKVVRTADEIRQAYEIGLRTHSITFDFAASLDSGNTISGSGDTSFTVDATSEGLPNKGTGLYVGDKIIVRENYDGTEYIAQGTVTSVNISTGAVMVASWDSGSTFPSGGYTVNADVFKWQKEYIDISDSFDAHINAVDNITWRVLDGNQGRTFWIDDLNMVSDYLTNPTGSTITSTPNQYFQYRIIETTTDTDPTPSVSSVTLDYSYPLIMTGGSTSQSYLYNGNKNAFNVQCNGVTIAQTGKTVYCEGSWDQTNWNTIGSASSPLSDATIQGTPDVTNWTGYPAGEGSVTIYVRAVVDGNPTSTHNFSVTKDTTPPAVTTITSVAGDPNSPYYDVTDDSSTLVVYTASADAATCKWDESDITYTAMTDTCTSTTNCTLDLSGYGAKTVYLACADTAGNYTDQVNNYQLDYAIGGITMTGAQSSMSFINNYNKTAYNIQCNGVTKPQAGTATCYASFDQSDWHEVDQTTTPVSGATLQDEVNVTGWTGYTPDGDKTIYTYVSDSSNDSEIFSFNSHVDTVYPVINSITSVAGDTTPPYEDASNNASTFVVFDASADSDVCRWSTNVGHDYDTMPNSCGVAGNTCNLTLTGVSAHTAYIRCIDTHGNKQQSSLQVDYEITSEAPVESGWMYYREITISPATSMNNYQVKIELHPGNFDYANAQDNGEDIRFFDVLGETKFDYWIETWNTAGTSEIWVEIPDSGTSEFLMEYGNSSATSESNYDNVFIRDYSHESGLSGQWLMNEGSGSTVADSSGQGNDGTRQGYAIWRDSEGGQWDGRSDIKFADGKHIYNNGTADSNSRITIADAPELDLTTGATVEMWYKPWNVVNWTRMLAKGQEGANLYAIVLNDSKKPYFYVNGPSSTTATATTTLVVNRWYHLVGTYDGTDIKMYLNGQMEGISSSTGNINVNDHALAIGNNADGSTDRPTYGYYDDVRVYSRALSAGEILAHYEHRLYDSANPQTIIGGVRTGTDDETGQENWFDDDWAHRTELTIINEGNINTLTDYQVQSNIDTKIYIDQSQMQADGDDIRFADSDGTTLMPYYIISGVNTNNTRIYVKIPSIPANNNKTIYMYYGNPAAGAYENFDNTFTKNSGFDGLAGSWHFDEGADNTCSDGDDACDDSGYGNNGVFNGAPAWQADEGAQWDSRPDLEFSTGDHLYFDGTDDYINVGNGSSMYQAGNHLVVSAWIKPTVSNQWMPIMAQRDAACGSNPNWHFYINDSNKLYFQTSNGAYGSASYTSTATIEPNIWTHVAVVYDGVYVNFYKNGQFVDRSALNALMYLRTTQMTFIGTETCGNFYEGYMDEVKLYTTKLNASQVLGLYEHRKASEPEPQAGYYRPSYEEVAGEIGSGTWTSGSTIYVSGPTTIIPGSTLLIEPGTVVKFAHSAYIVTDGSTVVAEGESGNPIYFTSMDDDTIGLTVEGSDGAPAAGDWNGVYVISPDAAGSFKFCNFNYGGETIILDGTIFRGQLNTKGVNIAAYNNVFNNSANADIFVYDASPDIQRNNLGDSPYGIYVEANGSIITNPIQYNSFSNTTIAAVYIDGLPDTDNNTGPGLTLRHNDIDNTNTGFYIDNPSGTTIRDANAENTVDARQNAFENLAGYMCYFDSSAGNCKFDRTAGGEILFDTNSSVISSPNGGESYFAASSRTINWTFNNGTTNGNHLDILLSTDSGSEFDQTIVANIKCDGSGAGPGCTGSTGSYTWTIPAVSTTEARLKISMKDSGGNTLIEDISDRNFTITVIEDTLTDYTPDADAKHTIKFVIDQYAGQYIDDSIKVTFPPEFDLSISASDVVASGGDVGWSGSEIIDTSSIVFPFTGTLDHTDGLITLTIGNNNNLINNPSSEGSYRIILTLHDGQAGGGFPTHRLATNVLINSGLAFNINVESALEFSIRDITDSTDITQLDFGDLEVNTVYNQSHILKVSTNAYHGYTVTMREEHDLSGTAGSVPDFTGTNSAPLAWTSPSGTGFYGYHTSDSTLGTGTTSRFASADRWAAITTTPSEIAYSNNLVMNDTTTMTYRLQVTSGQPSGSYSHTVLYVCTAKY